VVHPSKGSSQSSPVIAYIGLGGNLGDAQATVLAAVQQIAALPDVLVLQCSSLFGSAPVDAGGADYVNAVVQVQTRLTARVLLDQLHAIEQSAGRERPYRNAPRTLDLDLLLFGEEISHDTKLLLPHPRMWERAFVLRPLAEIAPALVSASQLHAVSAQEVWLLGRPA
jgi:2-amino-4-hydroxy-6-hydroxymethyldihydropteridine diphosphokinase